MTSINATETALMRKYLDQQCGLFLNKENEFLIETQLSDLVNEYGCESFTEFHSRFCRGQDSKMNDRIIDALTSKDTYWFRDRKVWNYLIESVIPATIEIAEQSGTARLWSTAASTGQEVYSLLIALNENEKIKQNPELLDRIIILGTDISNSALFRAISARYDHAAISRGLPENIRDKYFKLEGKLYVFDENLKKRVKFSRFNLLSNFMALGKFDLILCRYISSYYKQQIKRVLFKRLADALNPGGILLLGTSESLMGLTNRFDLFDHQDFAVNKLKNN